MGLDAFKSTPDRVGEKEKFENPELCPNCGQEGEHVRRVEWRCTTNTDECETLIWYHTNFKIKDATV